LLISPCHLFGSSLEPIALRVGKAAVLWRLITTARPSRSAIKCQSAEEGGCLPDPEKNEKNFPKFLRNLFHAVGLDKVGFIEAHGSESD
jgi:hypothetical protein